MSIAYSIVKYSLVSIYLKSMFYMSCLYNIQFAVSHAFFQTLSRSNKGCYFGASFSKHVFASQVSSFKKGLC